MTKNEQIAQVMGWTKHTLSPKWTYWISDKDENVFIDVDFFKPNKNIVLAKLLQQRMVDDGWNIQIQHFKSGVQVFARRSPVNFPNKYEHFSDVKLREPAAIVELFCKVYGIK